jgi:two-component system, OmpR family, sensor histidine kinase VicK
METASEIELIKRIGKVSRDAVFAFDLSNKQLLYCNDVFLRVFDADEKELFANPETLIKKVIKADLPHVRLKRDSLFRKGSLSNCEITISVSGVHKHLSCDLMIIRENDLLFGIIEDVTSQRLHDDFAINFGAQKDTLLDMLTHNLSAPLVLSKEILATIDRGKDPTLTRTLSLLKENTQFCLDIISDFLRYEHNMSLRTNVHKARFDAVERIRITLDKIKAMNQDKRIIFETGLPTLHVTTDTIKFFQVIHNVLSNSVKFTPEGGQITVSLEEKELDFIVSVKDSGIGIPASEQKFVFTDEVKVRQGLRGESSSGLGLTIAKRLVEMLEGRIYLESEEGKGTTVYIRLPRE